MLFLCATHAGQNIVVSAGKRLEEQVHQRLDGFHDWLLPHGRFQAQPQFVNFPRGMMIKIEATPTYYTNNTTTIRFMFDESEIPINLQVLVVHFYKTPNSVLVKSWSRYIPLAIYELINNVDRGNHENNYGQFMIHHVLDHVFMLSWLLNT